MNGNHGKVGSFRNHFASQRMASGCAICPRASLGILTHGLRSRRSEAAAVAIAAVRCAGSRSPAARPELAAGADATG
ncbi:MAG: hypothetical protein D6694_13950, partial [Gammaproteobacteria bacterium]